MQDPANTPERAPTSRSSISTAALLAQLHHWGCGLQAGGRPLCHLPWAGGWGGLVLADLYHLKLIRHLFLKTSWAPNSGLGDISLHRETLQIFEE